MAQRKPKPTPTQAAETSPTDAATTDAPNPAPFDPEMQAWHEEMAHACVAPALPTMAVPEGARTGEEESPKVPIPNPYPFRSDAQTGVVLLEDRQLRRMQLRFDMKPSDEVRQALRDAGFRWKSQHQAWETDRRPRAELDGACPSRKNLPAGHRHDPARIGHLTHEVA